MPLSVAEFQSTPNPNAIKCVLSGKTGEAVRSYFKASEAAGDALAESLFAVPGVTNLLIQPAWITVGKSPDAKWEAVKEGVRRALAGAGGGRGGEEALRHEEG